MTNLQLKTRLSQILGLARSGADSVEEWLQVQDVLNDGVIDILSRTRIYTRTVDLTLTANEDEYDWGPLVLQIHNLRRMRSDGTAGAELQEVMPGDISDSGSGSYAIMGFNRIKLGWLPTAGSSPNDLKLVGWYTPKPTLLSADGDDPSLAAYGGIPAQFHAGALVNYGAWKLAQIAEDPRSQDGESFRALYEGQHGDTPVGSDLGDIKYYINKRVSSGSQAARRRRDTERTTGDIDPAYWQG